MSKPLLQPNKFKNSLEDKPMMDRRPSNEGIDSPKLSKGESKTKSPRVESPVLSDVDYVEDGGQKSTEESARSYYNSKLQTTDDSSKPGASFQLKSDGKTFVSSFGEIENDFESDPIFKQLCPPNQYQGDRCTVCDVTFGLLKGRHHCKFCGKACCDEHSKKRRPDPQTPGSYVRICDVCDKKYINKMILDEFKGKLKRRDDELKELENKSAQYQKKLKEKQNTFDNQISEKNRKDKDINDKINLYIQKTLEAKEEIKRVEKDNIALNSKYAELHAQNEDLEKKIQDLRREEETQLKESETLSQKITAIEQDINQINKTIEDYDRALANNKIYATTSDTKSKQVSYNANPETLRAVQNSISQSGDRQSGVKGSLIGLKEPGYAKNEKTETGSCNTGCTIF